jgi:hypothetical protein
MMMFDVSDDVSGAFPIEPLLDSIRTGQMVPGVLKGNSSKSGGCMPYSN